MPDNRQPLLTVLAELFRRTSARRQRQLGFLVLFMIASAIGEIVTIGAVLPLLALVVTPDQQPFLQSLPYLSSIPAEQRVVYAAAALIIAAAITMAMRLALMWYSQTFVMGLGREIASSIFARMLRQPYRYYLETNTSTLLSGIEKTQILVMGVMQPAVLAVSSAVIALFIFGALMVLSPIAALAAGILAIGVYGALGFATRGLLTRNSNDLAMITNARIRAVQEGLGGIRDIILEHSQPQFEAEFARLDAQYRRAQGINIFLASAPRFLFEAIAIVAVALVAVYMATASQGLIAAIPTLGALALAAQRLLPLVQQGYLGFSNSMGNLQTLRDVVTLMQEPLSHQPHRRVTPVPFAHSITLDTISFHYASGEPVLKNLSLTIKKGQRIGIIGRTGAGKSSLFDIIMGLLEPTSGELRIDDQILDDQNRRGWQAQIAHVPQSIFLLDDSIAANIAFGLAKETIDVQRIAAAANAAGLGEFIASLTTGFDTVVGERGIRISGGQKQRIGIARALYKNPSVLILDEASSALDATTETAVLDAIMGLNPDMTILMIAHRHATLAKCDAIFALDNGQLAATNRSCQ